MQGYFGASFYEISRDKSGSIGDLQDEDSTLPTIGGGAQWKLAGNQVDLGLEALIGFAGRGNVSAFASGPGGTLVAVDIDLLVFQFYGGPFFNVFLNEQCRVYVAAGPMMEWASYDQSAVSGFSSSSGDGFGIGYYARTGFEFMISRGTMIGLGARWTDSTIDLDGGLGDLEVHGVEALLTLTRGF
jgi:hypothetical protein